jgi:hypothetical protein
MRFFFKFFVFLLFCTAVHVHAICKHENCMTPDIKNFTSSTRSNNLLLAKHKNCTREKHCKRGKRGKSGKRGKRGPQGAPGALLQAQNKASIYGSFYFDPTFSDGVMQIIPPGSSIPFTGNTQVAGFDITNMLSGEITVLTPGDYLIKYEIKNLNFIGGVAYGGTPFYRVGIKLNGVVQNPTVGFMAPLEVTQKDLAISEYGYIAGQAILSLTEGDSITLDNLGNRRDPSLVFIAPPLFNENAVYVGPYAILTIFKLK